MTKLEPSAAKGPTSLSGWLAQTQNIPPGGENPGHLSARGGHIHHVHQRVVGNHNIEGVVREWPRGTIRQYVATCWI
jgi:hypothetical protein